MMVINWKGTLKRLAWWIGIALAFGFFYYGVVMVRKFAAMSSSPYAAAVVVGVSLLVFGGVSGYLFGRLCWPWLAERFIDFLLLSGRRLKTPPPSLSPVRGKILREEFDAAREELEALAEKYPASGEIQLELFNFRLDRLGSAESAYAGAKKYLATRDAAPERLTLLERTADLLAASGRTEEAEQLLEAESRRLLLYSEIDRKTIRRRLSALKGEAS